MVMAVLIFVSVIAAMELFRVITVKLVMMEMRIMVMVAHRAVM